MLALRFQGLFELMLKDEGFLGAAKASSVSFVIEAGNKHNHEIKKSYERMKQKHCEALPFLGEMDIVAKDSSIADNGSFRECDNLRQALTTLEPSPMSGVIVSAPGNFWRQSTQHKLISRCKLLPREPNP